MCKRNKPKRFGYEEPCCSYDGTDEGCEEVRKKVEYREALSSEKDLKAPDLPTELFQTLTSKCSEEL